MSETVVAFIGHAGYFAPKNSGHQGTHAKDAVHSKAKSNLEGRAALQVQKQKLCCPFCKEPHFPAKCKGSYSVELKKL